MKKYKRKKIRYWFDSFEHLQPFDIISMEEMKKLYDDVYDQIEKQIELNKDKSLEECSIKFERAVDGLGPDKKSERVYYQTTYLPRADVDFPPAEKYCYSMQNPKHYSLVQREGDKAKRIGYGTQLVADPQFKKTWVDKVLYLELPQDLILEYMTTNQNCDLETLKSYKGGTLYDRYNIRKVKDFIDEVESSKYSWKSTNYIPIMDKYDEMYPDLVAYAGTSNKAPVFYKWRHGFIVHQYISQKDYGLVFPVFLNSAERIFFDGSHRLSQIPLSKNDLPFFVKLSETLLDRSYLSFVVPPYFDNKSLLLEVDLNNKKVIYSEIDRKFYDEWRNKIHKILYDNWHMEETMNRIKDRYSDVYDMLMNKKIIGESTLK